MQSLGRRLHNLSEAERRDPLPRPATPSHKHGLCPPFGFPGVHVEHRRPKAGDAPHEGLLKVERRGFRSLEFRV